MGWIGCVRCEKFRCDFMEQTCALIAPVQPVLHRVSCTNEILTNATKHYETQIYMSLGSNAVARVCSLRKISMQFRATNFCIYCTEFCAVTKQIQNVPKQYETNQYLSLGSNGVDRVHSLRKIPMRLNGTNLSINCTSSTHFAPSSV